MTSDWAKAKAENTICTKYQIIGENIIYITRYLFYEAINTAKYFTCKKTHTHQQTEEKELTSSSCILRNMISMYFEIVKGIRKRRDWAIVSLSPFFFFIWLLKRWLCREMVVSLERVCTDSVMHITNKYFLWMIIYWKKQTLAHEKYTGETNTLQESKI